MYEYLAIIINVLVITWAEIIEMTKTTSTQTVPTKSTPKNFNEKKVTCETENLYIFLSFINYHNIIDGC